MKTVYRLQSLSDIFIPINNHSKSLTKIKNNSIGIGSV